MEPGSVDIVILVFVMSALHPDEWDQAISNIHKVSREFIEKHDGLTSR
jgi:tRNAThr (cytosine32-N3)-methyltransferase